MNHACLPEALCLTMLAWVLLLASPAQSQAPAPATPAAPHRPSVQECREVGEFVRNAALSRDNGVSESSFMDRLEGDLMAIRGHPPALRWFAQDRGTEAFLMRAAKTVFANPREPREHETETVRACLDYIADGAT